MDLQRAVMRPDAIPRALQYLGGGLAGWRLGVGYSNVSKVLHTAKGEGRQCRGIYNIYPYGLYAVSKQPITLWHGIMIVVSSHSKIHNAHNNETAARDRLPCHMEYKSHATLTICYAVHDPLNYHSHEPLDYALAFLSFSCSCGVRLLNTSPNVGCCACSWKNCTR